MPRTPAGVVTGDSPRYLAVLDRVARAAGWACRLGQANVNDCRTLRLSEAPQIDGLRGRLYPGGFPSVIPPGFPLGITKSDASHCP